MLSKEIDLLFILIVCPGDRVRYIGSLQLSGIILDGQRYILLILILILITNICAVISHHLFSRNLPELFFCSITIRVATYYNLVSA
jgi:hypothetical protein